MSRIWKLEPSARAWARRRAQTEARKFRMSRASGGDRLNIGAHDGPDPSDLSKAPDLVWGYAPPPQPFAQSLKGDVEADLVAVAEAVDDRLGGLEHGTSTPSIQ